jgi:hypothetical protein
VVKKIGQIDKLLNNSIVQFMLAMFIIVILWRIPAFASFSDAIYDALGTSFEFLPIIAVFGALRFIKSSRR